MRKSTATAKKNGAASSQVPHAVRLKIRVPASRRLTLTLPKEVPAGDAELVVLQVPAKRSSKGGPKGRDPHPAFGMWADHPEAAKPAAFAAELRRRVWERRARGS